MRVQVACDAVVTPAPAFLAVGVGPVGVPARGGESPDPVTTVPTPSAAATGTSRVRCTPTAGRQCGGTGVASCVPVGCPRPGSVTGVSQSLLDHDLALGHRLVAGADEAGRGCLAGPIVCAAVCFDVTGLDDEGRSEVAALEDSKRLTSRRRAVLADVVMRRARQVVVVSANARSIDAHGLHATNLRIMREALAALDPPPGIILVDGFHLGEAAPPHRRLVRGDATSAAVAAASVIAKEARDRLMRGPAAAAYPGYGFDRHVGYITAAHVAAVRTMGPTPLHRRSFRSRAYDDDMTLFGDAASYDGPNQPGPPGRHGHCPGPRVGTSSGLR